MAKVLLADASVTIQKVVDLVLSDKGYEVKTVNSGGEALAALSSFRPDIVLADTRLPDINGYELTQKMRNGRETKETPVILLSGAFDPVDVERMKKSGANGFLTKPFESDDLIRRISTLLSEMAVEEAEAEEEALDVVEEAGEEAVEIIDDEAVEAESISEADIEAAVSEGGSLEVEEASHVEAVSKEETSWDAPYYGRKAGGGKAGGEEARMPGVEELLGVFKDMADYKLGEFLKGKGDVIKSSMEHTLGDLEASLMEAAKDKLGEVVASGEMKEELMETLAQGIKDSVEKVLWEVAPELTEKLLKEALRDSLGSLKKEIENVIWETVPGLAESIIKDEIKKIRAKG